MRLRRGRRSKRAFLRITSLKLTSMEKNRGTKMRRIRISFLKKTISTWAFGAELLESDFLGPSWENLVLDFDLNIEF